MPLGIVMLCERGYRYILTIIDYATRYCDALPLKTISTVEVAECLLHVFSRVGVPLEILSDLGIQFVSDLMKEISRLMSIKGLVQGITQFAMDWLKSTMA